MNKGFSLVELIVVIAIMAILVGVAVPVYTNYIGEANNKVDAQLVGEIEHAVEVLLIDPSVTSPESLVITLSAAGVYSHNITTDGASKTVADNFVRKLGEIVPASALKGQTYKNGATFTISGYTCTVEAVPAQP